MKLDPEETWYEIREQHVDIDDIGEGGVDAIGTCVAIICGKTAAEAFMDWYSEYKKPDGLYKWEVIKTPTTTYRCWKCNSKATYPNLTFFPTMLVYN
jgi:hypothetical protein